MYIFDYLHNRWSNSTHGLHSKINCLWIVEDLSTFDMLLRKERGSIMKKLKMTVIEQKEVEKDVKILMFLSNKMLNNR